MRYLLAVTAVAFSVVAQAASVNKCMGQDGKITFTQQACPGGGQPDEVVKARNAAPSGSGPAVEMISPEWRAFDEVEQPGAQVRVTVVGGRDEKTCSTGLSERDERTAMVRRQALKGMTQLQIESIYGKPDTTTTANGQVDYRYWNGYSKEYVHISFDRDGCADWVYQSTDN